MKPHASHLAIAALLLIMGISSPAFADPPSGGSGSLNWSSTGGAKIDATYDKGGPIKFDIQQAANNENLNIGGQNIPITIYTWGTTAPGTWAPAVLAGQGATGWKPNPTLTGWVLGSGEDILIVEKVW